MTSTVFDEAMRQRDEAMQHVLRLDRFIRLYAEILTEIERSSKDDQPAEAGLGLSSEFYMPKH